MDRPAPVARGEVCSRVVCSGRFFLQLVLTAIVCFGAHVLAAWLGYKCWGHCPFPNASDTAAYACLESFHPPPAVDHRRINLMTEVFIDSLITAFFASGAQLASRIKDVQAGRLPMVLPEAFPRGCLLRTLYPPCRKRGGAPATRHDHLHNLGSWGALVLIWGLGWGAFTLAVLEVLRTATGAPLCLAPWRYIFARAAWTDIEAILVVGGSYTLWSTRGEGTADEAYTPYLHDYEAQAPAAGGGLNGTRVPATATKPLAALREPLASPTASSFVSVD